MLEILFLDNGGFWLGARSHSSVMSAGIQVTSIAKVLGGRTEGMSPHGRIGSLAVGANSSRHYQHVILQSLLDGMLE